MVEPEDEPRYALGLLVENFAPEGALVLGVDATLDRRQGKRIATKGSTVADFGTARETVASRWPLELHSLVDTLTLCHRHLLCFVTSS